MILHYTQLSEGDIEINPSDIINLAKSDIKEVNGSTETDFLYDYISDNIYDLIGKFIDNLELDFNMNDVDNLLDKIGEQLDEN